MHSHVYKTDETHVYKLNDRHALKFNYTHVYNLVKHIYTEIDTHVNKFRTHLKLVLFSTTNPRLQCSMNTTQFCLVSV